MRRRRDIPAQCGRGSRGSLLNRKICRPDLLVAVGREYFLAEGSDLAGQRGFLYGRSEW